MTIAIYVRLSLEDGTEQESASIGNQRLLLLDFIRNSPDLYGAKVVEFSDDGYSGKNFDRPGVQALLKAAFGGEVQCILVKDISRFGRDYITVGNYITRVFPFKGLRFISVNDNFDSNRKGDIDSLDRAFRALIYDLYSRDISKKVKSAKLRLAQQGININPVAPYGYLKDPGDRHRLIPDPRTAPIVQRIFTLVADGTSTEKVAMILNTEGIPTPSQIKVGTSSAHANWLPNYWRRAAIDWIIRDRQYIGSMVYGKRVRPRIGVHQQLTAKLEDWIIVEDRHEPLVSKELFARAQERLGGEQRQLASHNKAKNPLSKKVYCGICGYAIIRRGTKNRYYCCQTPRTVPGMACYPEKIYESEILDTVTGAILQQARCVVEAQHMIEQQKKSQEATVALLRKKVKSLEALQRELNQKIEKLYEDAVIDNLLSRDAYAAQKARLVEQRDNAQKAEAEIQAEIFEQTRDCSIYAEQYQLYADMEVLPDEAGADLLDRVTVWPDGRVEVLLRFLDELPTWSGAAGRLEAAE